MIDYAPDAAFRELEGKVTTIQRDYARCFDELKRREKETVGDLKKRVERLEKRLGEVDQSLIRDVDRLANAHRVLCALGDKREREATKALDKLQEASKRPFATKRMLNNLQEKMTSWRTGLLEGVKSLDDRCLKMDTVQIGLINELSSSLDKSLDELEATKEQLGTTVEGLNDIQSHLNL